MFKKCNKCFIAFSFVCGRISEISEHGNPTRRFTGRLPTKKLDPFIVRQTHIKYYNFSKHYYYYLIYSKGINKLIPVSISGKWRDQIWTCQRTNLRTSKLVHGEKERAWLALAAKSSSTMEHCRNAAQY